MMIDPPRPSESPYAYLERIRRQMGTDYVYIIQDSDIVSAPHGRVNLDVAQRVLDAAARLAASLPEDLNAVVAEPAAGDGKIHIYRISGRSFVVAYVPKKSEKNAVMRFEELVV